MALLSDYLIAHYKMNDNAADKVVADSSGNSHTGASVQNTEDISVPGKVNTALDFNGSSDYIDYGDPSDIDMGSNGFSVGVWIKLNILVTGKSIISKDSNDSRQFLFQTDPTTGDEIDFIVFDTDSTFKRFITSDGNMVANQWYFIVSTSDGAGSLKVYVDGIEKSGTASGTGDGSMQATSAKLIIGADDETPIAKYFNGTIDNMMIFNKALTSLEVKYLYNSGAGVENIPTLIELSRTGQGLASQQW